MTANVLSKSEIAGVLLAGGQSRRMGGGDKGLMDIGGSTMLGRVIGRLSPQVAGMALNANGDPARFAEFGLPVVADTIEGHVGPLAGVLAGLRWAQTAMPGASHIVTASTDAPFLPLDLVTRLADKLASSPENAIALAKSDGHLHPVIGLWPVKLADDLETALRDGVRKVLHWTDRHGTLGVEFEFTDIAGRAIDPFFNANTPEELNEVRELLKS